MPIWAVGLIVQDNAALRIILIGASPSRIAYEGSAARCISEAIDSALPDLAKVDFSQAICDTTSMSPEDFLEHISCEVIAEFNRISTDRAAPGMNGLEHER